MSVSAIGPFVGLTTQSLVDMRSQLDDLQRQLGTGKKSVTYAGVGVDRGVAVGLRSQLSALSSYDDTVTTVGVRIDLANTALSHIAQVESDVQASARSSNYDIDNTGQTTAQKSAAYELDDVLNMLSSQSGD